MRTHEEMIAIARTLENEKLLASYQNAIENTQNAVFAADGKCCNHTAYDWDEVANVCREEILRRMSK